MKSFAQSCLQIQTLQDRKHGGYGYREDRLCRYRKNTMGYQQEFE